MEGEFQYNGQLDKELEEWLSPRVIKPDHGLFYEEGEKEYIQIEGLVLKR